MLRKITVSVITLATLGSLSTFAFAAAAPERTVGQTYSERVASGAASLMMKGIAAGYEAHTPAPDEAGDPVIVHVRFTANGDLDDFSRRMDGFAPFLSNTSGLAWKVWALDPESRHASGTYMFETLHHAEMYLSEVLPQGMEDVPYISDMDVTITPVMVGPSITTNAVRSTQVVLAGDL